MRRSELLGLTWDAVDLETGTLSIRRTVTEVAHRTVVREIPKSKQSRRTLSIPPAVVALLREQRARINAQVLAWGKDYMRDPFFCFPGPAGEPWRPLRLTARLRRLCRRAKVANVQPVHGWRHAAATLMIADGADVKTTQARLGHSSPTITLALYTDRIDERDRAAGERLAGYLTRGRNHMTEDDATLLITEIEPRLSKKYPLDENHKLRGVRVYCPREQVGLEIWVGDRFVTVELRKDEAAEIARRILLAVNYVLPKAPAPHQLRRVTPTNKAGT